MCSGTLWVSPMNSPVRLGVSQPPQVFSISGLRLYFPTLELLVVQSMAGSTSCCLAASCSFAHPAPQSATLLGQPATALPRVLSARLPISTPPTALDESFFFISLVVGFPYSSIFCQFWLFFALNLLLSFFWLCKEAQCIYLHLHLGWKSCLLYTSDAADDPRVV